MTEIVWLSVWLGLAESVELGLPVTERLRLAEAVLRSAPEGVPVREWEMDAVGTRVPDLPVWVAL